MGVVPYIQSVTEPTGRILSNCNIKVALKLYLTYLSHTFAKPKGPVHINQKTHAVSLYHAVNRNNGSYSPQEYLVNDVIPPVYI